MKSKLLLLVMLLVSMVGFSQDYTRYDVDNITIQVNNRGSLFFNYLSDDFENDSQVGCFFITFRYNYDKVLTILQNSLDLKTGDKTEKFYYTKESCARFITSNQYLKICDEDWIVITLNKVQVKKIYDIILLEKNKLY